ncbi:hypothetical protein GWK47_047730 [Chionoecetes opilio]|uniref:Peptidase A2 domain-containing protein n=1 Tax=Chionoecetes opilio TaxID=41210 RepID=A0A8J4YCK8_CHIOP|nr:hypothetical protein GWK47_047730 [Chionoecetes opilio]
MTPTPVCVHLVHGESTSRLQMLPDTGADVTVIGTRHLQMLHIPLSSLQSLPSTTTLTADGSVMTPAVGCFYATLRLHGKSCTAKIQVYEGIQTPLLSYGHCMELAIISPAFPKPLLEVKHINRCAEMTHPPTTSPSAARAHFLREL